MKVLVDTSIWSQALRRKANLDTGEVKELFELIKEFRVLMIGPIRQELLSGITDEKNFEDLKEKLKAYDDLKPGIDHYEYAAQLYNTCRKNGIQGSHVDFLICAVGILNNCSIFTSDKDFEKYKSFLDIKLHIIREEFR